MYLKGNKQEWGKIFAILKLLHEGEIYIGSKNKEKKDDNALLFVKMVRQTENGRVFFSNNADYITIKSNDEIKSVSKERIKAVSTTLLSLIKGKDEEFECGEAENLMGQMSIFDFNSNSLDGDDYIITFYNQQFEAEQTFPVKIKSNLSKLYLIASNRASNFRYDILQLKLSGPEIQKINSFGDNETGSLLRLDEIERLGGKIKYNGVEGKFFFNAMQLIDMQLPKLIGEMVRLFYTGEHVTVKELTHDINEINLFKVKTELIEKGRIYEYKIRQLLYAAACGLKPTKTWRGNNTQHSWIFVNEKAEILLYETKDKEDFEKFLFFNTRFSIANEDKSKFGIIERENGIPLIKLNFEVRFI
ncbi:MAG: HpaII family restriction endonuclease [Bacteroidales bacterium]|nr:HpaII family restriction endonuclease [Bacteroidales bacterium]